VLNCGSDGMELAAMESAVKLAPRATKSVTLGFINMSPDHRNYEISASGPWRVALSVSRINGLASGSTPQFTPTITAPRNSPNTTEQIRIAATDLFNPVPSSREVSIPITVTGVPVHTGKHTHVR